MSAVPADLKGMFEWQTSYSMGVPEIDREHQTLFRLAAELHGAMLGGKGNAVMGKLLERLVQYTAVHFAHEERLMRDAAYPAYEEHKAEHASLTREVMKFSQRFAAGNVTITVQLFQFLKGWLLNHIAASDAKYVPFVKNRAA